MADQVDQVEKVENEQPPVDNDNPNKIKSLLTLQNFLSEQNESNNAIYISDVPKKCKEFPCVLGIDEAGRGPVLGPMVYGIAFCPINRADLLIKLECDDSKALTEEKREEIFVKMCDNYASMGWAVEVISPNSICNNMLSRSKISLNQVSMDSAIGLVRRAIADGVKIEHVYVDTVGPPEKYQAYLKTLFPQFQITVAKKADSKYPIVSAASIAAKVSRDHALKVWRFREGIKLAEEGFGSGYPGDPVTKNFLRENVDVVFGFPQLVRFSWSTAEKLLETNAYHVEFDAEEPDTPPDNTAITSFFKATGKGKKGRDNHEFFKIRGLSSTNSLS